MKSYFKFSIPISKIPGKVIVHEPEVHRPTLDAARAKMLESQPAMAVDDVITKVEGVKYATSLSPTHTVGQDEVIIHPVEDNAPTHAVGDEQEVIPDNAEVGRPTHESAGAKMMDYHQPVMAAEDLDIIVDIDEPNEVSSSYTSSRLDDFMKKHTTKEIRDLCRQHDVSAQGKKAQLAMRYLAHEGQSTSIVIVS